MEIEPNYALYGKLREFLSSNQDIFEILFTYHSLKMVSRLVLSEDKFVSLRDLIKKYGLSMQAQDYKILPISDKGKGNFSNKLQRIPLNYTGGKYLAYISKSEEDSLLAKKFENSGNFDLGKILGYPECCINFFIQNKEEKAKKQMDFIIPACKSLSKFPFVNNRCLRYFGINVLSHFPCSFDCKRSKKIGESFFNLIKKYDPFLASKMERELKSFVLYTEYDGVFYSKDYSFKNKIIKYDKIIGTVEGNKIYDALSKNNMVKCKNYNDFKIGDLRIQKDAVVAMFK